MTAAIKASEKPKFYLPVIGLGEPENLISGPLNVESFDATYGLVRQQADLLNARAMRNAGNGDPAGALRDFTAMIRLAALLDKQPLLESRLKARALDKQINVAAATLASSIDI